jgi:glutamate dehydrogenase (NADP+)
MNKYTMEVLEKVKKRNAGEPEFIQTVEEVFKSLDLAIEQNPQYEKVNLLERIAEPERQIIFRVSWVDDAGNVQVNRGYRVQFNSAIGPYKGGIRFHHTVNLSIMKFLAFEQTFKNSLTSLPMGGGKGGADFDPRGKSDGEIMRFCQAYMTELWRHIGPDLDVPAGDIGVAAREIGYLYGQYKRIKNVWENGVLTGKGLSYGGSLFRPEATGYGAVYFLNEVLKANNDTIEGKTIAISGFGNVAWGVLLKAHQMGAKVITISGPDGYVLDEEGIYGDDKIKCVLALRASGNDRVGDYVKEFPNAKFFPGEKPWGVKADILMPCATQNEVGMTEAEMMVKNGIKYYIEVSNMPTTNEALDYLMDNGLIVGPSKAVNAGGVATSGLEMSQNSQRLSWSGPEVDEKLHTIMVNIHKACAEASAEFGLGYNLVAGANLAGFKKIAEAMMAQGVI